MCCVNSKLSREIHGGVVSTGLALALLNPSVWADETERRGTRGWFIECDSQRWWWCQAFALPRSNFTPIFSVIKISCYWNIGIPWSYPVMDVALGSWALTWGQSEDLGWISGLFLNGEPCNSRLSYAAAGAWPNHSVSWRLCTPPLPGPPASSPVIPLPQLVQVLTFHRQTH